MACITTTIPINDHGEEGRLDNHLFIESSKAPHSSEKDSGFLFIYLATGEEGVCIDKGYSSYDFIEGLKEHKRKMEEARDNGEP